MKLAFSWAHVNGFALGLGKKAFQSPFPVIYTGPVMLSTFTLQEDSLDILDQFRMTI